MRTLTLTMTAATLVMGMFQSTVQAGRLPTAKAEYAAGLKHVEAKAWEKAKDAFNRAIAIDPDFADAYRERALVWSRFKDGERNAFADVEKALELDAADNANHQTRALLNINLKKNYRKAIPDLVRASELAPQIVANHNIRGYCRLQLKEYEEAVLDFNEALKLNPKFVNSLQHRAECWYSLGLYKVALKDYSAAVALETEKNTRLDYCTGECHYQLKQYAQAIIFFEKSLTQNKEDAGNYVYVGHCRRALKQYSKALAAYDKALAIDNENPNILTSRALTLTDLGRHDEAAADNRRAIRLEADLTK